MEKLAVRQECGERQQGSLVPPCYGWHAHRPLPLTGTPKDSVCLRTQGSSLAQTQAVRISAGSVDWQQLRIPP